MKNFKKFFRVYRVWVKMVWLYHLEYRFNAILNSFGSVFWLLGTLFIYRLIFSQVRVLAGWRWEDLLVLYGIYNFWWGMMSVFGIGGLRIAEHIRNGSLDRVLLWPGSGLFYAAMKFEPELLLHSFSGLLIFFLSFKAGGVILTVPHIFLFLVVLLNAFILIFFAAVIFGCTAFWFTENSEVVHFFWVWETLAQYPSEFFKPLKFLSFAVYTVIPVVFIAALPAEVILGKINWNLIAGAFLATFIFGLLARAMWRAGLKRHTGVSI